MKKVFRLFCLIVLLCVSCFSDKKSELEAIAITDKPLEIPKPGEWLAEHEEKGQTFEAYTTSKPLQVSLIHQYIYILPIGNFSTKEDFILDKTVRYLELFYGVSVRKMTPLQEKIIPKNRRRNNENGEEQLDASYILDSIILPKKPKDALVVMGLTSKDLYPSPSWNFVFGLATYSKGVGITSFARYDPNNADYRVCLRRTIRTSAHEIGHMFQMKHCTHAKCVMNGVNSLSEDDTKPNTLCSVCLQKLHWNFDYEVKTRFKNLLSFYKEHDLQTDYNIMLEQYNALKN